MRNWTNINIKQIIQEGITIVFGSVIAICVNAALTFYHPVHWIHPLFFIRIISVAFGSFFSGIVSRKYAWITGLIIAVIHFIYIVFMFYPTEPLIVNNKIVIPSHNWTSILPTGIFMIFIGLICGYLGGQLNKKIKAFREHNT